MSRDLTDLLDATGHEPSDVPAGVDLVQRGRRRRRRRHLSLAVVPLLLVAVAVAVVPRPGPSTLDIVNQPSGVTPPATPPSTNSAAPVLQQVQVIPGAYGEHGTPSGITVAFDSVWLAQADSAAGNGVVTRVYVDGDHRIEAVIPIASTPVAIAATADHVWVARAGGLTRIDPANSEVDLEVELDIDPAFLLATPTGFWVATGFPAPPMLLRVESATGEVSVHVDLDLDGQITGIAITERNVLVGVAGSGVALLDVPGPETVRLAPHDQVSTGGSAVSIVAAGRGRWYAANGVSGELLNLSLGSGRLGSTRSPLRDSPAGDVLLLDDGQVLVIDGDGIGFASDVTGMEPVIDASGLGSTVPVAATADGVVWLAGETHLGRVALHENPFANGPSFDRAFPHPCEAPRDVADIDGDGRDDILAPDTNTNELVVCLADGTERRVLWDGMFEVLRVGDVDDDGAEEVFFGGTTAYSAIYEMGRWVDGALVIVTLAEGSPLQLTDGALGFDEAGRPERAAWGCADLDGDGADELLSVAATTTDGVTLSVVTTAFHLDGATAVQVEQRRGETAVDDGGEYLVVVDPALPPLMDC